MRRGRLFLVVSAILTASFFLASVAAFTQHSDDGCPVEMHCFACHWAFASAAVVALPIALTFTVQAAGEVQPALVSLAREVRAGSVSSRGPPLI